MDSPKILETLHVIQRQLPLEGVSEDDLRGFMILLVLFSSFLRLITKSHAGFSSILSIPPSMTRMLSDNILLYDALGRVHNLPYIDFGDWSTLRAKLRDSFITCPGFEKVSSGQFIITDIYEPEQDVGGWNWESLIKRNRKRFKMSIIMSQLVMSDGLCNKCDMVAVRNVSESTFACPSCGLFYRSSSHSRKRFRLEDLKSSQRDICGSYLEVPIIPQEEAPFWKLYFDATKQQPETLLGIGSIPLVNPDQGVNFESETEIRGPRGQQSQNNIPSNIAVASESVTPSGGNDTQEEELPNEDEELRIQMNPKPDNTQLAVEEEEIQVLKSISIRQTTPLYNAALYRDLSSMRALLAERVRADQHTGYWGTPLTAAAFARFDEGVDLLLRNNAKSALGRWTIEWPPSSSYMSWNNPIIHQHPSARTDKPIEIAQKCGGLPKRGGRGFICPGGRVRL